MFHLQKSTMKIEKNLQKYQKVLDISIMKTIKIENMKLGSILLIKVIWVIKTQIQLIHLMELIIIVKIADIVIRNQEELAKKKLLMLRRKKECNLKEEEELLELRIKMK